MGVFHMNNKTIGMMIFVAGIIFIIGYSLYNGFEEYKQTDPMILTGFGITTVGFLIIFISLIIEQQKGKKKMNDEISEEDLEP